MKCPYCEFARVPKGAAICPKCGKEVPSGAQVAANQRAKRIAGGMVGVQAYGDILGGQFHTVQVYALSTARRAESWDRFLEDNTPPYKSLAPYAAKDRVLFFGRDAKTHEVVQQTSAGRVVVLYGPAGVGKTSLLAAGVIPQLMENGALVVGITDYLEPLETAIRAALEASAQHVRTRLPQNGGLPKLVQAIVKGTRGSLVLVLDQFERLFEPPVDEAQRGALTASLVQALREVDPRLFRLILALREDAWPTLAQLQQQLPVLRGNSVELKPLTREQAQAAIEQPLAKSKSPVRFVGDLVPKQLLPDLDELTPKTPDAIQPAQLQIVCSRLYEAACQREPPHIDLELYARQAKGANGILASYAEDMLHTQLRDQEVLAKRLLATLAAPGTGGWLSPERLPRDGSPPEQVQDVLQRLVDMQLLADRRLDGGYEYGFSSPSVAEAVRQMADPDVRGRVQAEEELERIWVRWLAYLDKPQYDALATRGQLRYLAETGAHLTPSAIQALLVLRSAVTRAEPAGPWLEALGKGRSSALIAQLETPDAVKAANLCTVSTQDKAERLLGLQETKPPQGKPYGRVAWAAVNHVNPKIRQTAALALSVLNPVNEDGLNRVDRALLEMADQYQLRNRRAELHGALSDASPELEEKIRKRDRVLPRLDRVWIEWWRARRRIFRDRQRIAVLTLGGSLGAGLGYGLLRAISAAIIHLTVGAQFFIQSYVGAILGAALTLGLLLTKYLMPAQSAAKQTMSSEKPARTLPMTSLALAAIGLGTLLFGIAHSAIATLIGQHLVAGLLVAPLGFVAGLGLSLAVQGQPEAGWRLGVGQWLWRLGAAIVAFLSTQLVFILRGIRDGSISIVWYGQLYHQELNRHLWWNGIVTAHPQLINYVSLLDAALAAIVLAIGTTGGVRLAARWLAKRQTAVSQLGD